MEAYREHDCSGRVKKPGVRTCAYARGHQSRSMTPFAAELVCLSHPTFFVERCRQNLLPSRETYRFTLFSFQKYFFFTYFTAEVKRAGSRPRLLFLNGSRRQLLLRACCFHRSRHSTVVH